MKYRKHFNDAELPPGWVSATYELDAETGIGVLSYVTFAPLDQVVLVCQFVE